MPPIDATGREQMLWAALAAIIGIAIDGPEADDRRRFRRIEAACQSFGVPIKSFDAVARRFDFHYYRPWDCYLGRDQIADAMQADTCFH